jgi:hypothetical protein
MEPVVLARGSSSDHWHEIDSAATERTDGGFVVDLPRPAVLRVGGQPDRHGPITIPAGSWAVQVQRVYTPAGPATNND